LINLSFENLARGFVGGWPRFGRFIQTRKFGLLMALLSLTVISIYVFLYAPYQDFIFSDMKGFWNRTMERLDGLQFRDSQFQVWPPIYHILLAEFFRLLRWIGLENWIRLETPLAINILVFAISVYAFQRVAVRWFVWPKWMLVTVLLYAFGFPALYFNAFLLSDNLSAPLMVIAVSLVISRQSWKYVVIGALLFGAVAAIRPSFGPYGLAFIALYLARYGFNWQFIRRAAVFTAVFFTVVACASAEVSRISGGRVNGLSANGGLDFFIANSHYYRVELRYDGWHFFVIVPGLSWKPENGVFYTNVPFYNQTYYFNLGWEHIKHNPIGVLENFGHVRNLFFADMLPSRYDAPGFRFWRPVWKWMKFGMFIMLGLYFWMWRSLGPARRPAFYFMATTLGVTLLVSIIFTGEPRYTYSILFIFYLLFFKLVELMWADWRRWWRTLMVYAGLLLLGSGAVSAAMALYQPNTAYTVRTNIQPSELLSPMPGQPSLQPQQFEIRRMLFPHRKTVTPMHANKKYALPAQPARIQLHTRLAIDDSTEFLPVQFEFNSSWPFQFMIDGTVLYQSNVYPDYFTEILTYAELKPGVHDIELLIDYTPIPGGFAANYSYWQDGWRHRQIIGLDTDKVHFLPLTESISVENNAP
jgi:hypothetical protein